MTYGHRAGRGSRRLEVSAWRPSVALVLGSALVLLAGAQFDLSRRVEAIGGLIAVPLLASLLGILDLWKTKGPLRALAVVAAALAIVPAELEVSSVVFPPEPLATTTLSAAHPDALVEIPEALEALEVETTVTVVSDSAPAGGDVVLQLDRGERKARVATTFNHSATPLRGRRGAGTTAFRAPHVARSEIDLPGKDGVTIHLAELSGALAPSVVVTVRRPARALLALHLAMAVAALLALAVQLLAARRQLKTYLAAGVGVTAVFGLYARLSFDPFHPGGSALATVFVAIVFGGGAGLGCAMVLNQIIGGPFGSAPATGFSKEP